MASLIRLNSLDYVVKGRVQRYTQTPFAEVFRTIGMQRREDIQTATGFVFGVPIYGFGRRRITKLDDPVQIRQMWDSQVMTHFESQVSLAPLRVADTGERYVIRGSAVFKGSLWSIWFHDGGVGGNQVVASDELTSATDTAWGGAGSVSDTSDASNRGAFDLTVHKDRLVALWYVTTSHQIAFSTSGTGNWTQATTDITAALLTSRAGSTDFDGGLLATVGNELVAIIYNEGAGTIQFFSSTNSGADMGLEPTVVIPSNSGVKGVAVYVGIDGATKLLVGTENGVYEVDTAPATWTATLIIPIRYHQDNARRMCTHQGAVWIPVGANSGEPAGMIRYTVSGDTRLIENSVGVNGETLGLDAFDGVPSDKLGPFNWLKSTGKYLLAAVGGTASSRNGHLLIHNGLGWHYLARNTTADQRCYWVDDINGTPHYANRTAAATTDTLGVRDALVNPASGLAIAREASGVLDHPEFDGGMPRYNAAWLEVFGDAVDLSADATGEYIAVAYGLNGATPSTSLGNLLSGDLDLLFGTGGIGVSARSIQVRETYYRDATDNTHTPTGRGLEVTYFKNPPLLEAWAFVVDLDETAKFTLGGMETAITNLRTVRDSVVKVPFVYGRMTSVNVKMVPPLLFEEELEETGTIGSAARRGTVQVIVREMN